MPLLQRARAAITPVRLAWLLLAAGWLVLSGPWLLGSYTIPYDAKAHFQAQIQFLAQALHAGQSPFWAPYVFGGTPQIADPQSLIFSPAIVLAWLVENPTFRLVDAYVFGLLLVGAASVFAYTRDRGWHPAGGVAAALAFAFGASAAWRVQHIGQVASLAMFAIAFWLLGRALERRSMAWGAAAGAASALMLVEPDQVALLGAYVLAGLVVSHIVVGGRPLAGVRTLLPVLSAGAVVGLVLLALPMLMTWLFATASTRPAIAFGEALHGSLHPASLLTGLVSDLYGAHSPAVDYWGPYSERWLADEWYLSQNMSEIYLGALPAVLIVTVGIWRRLLWAREVRFLTLAGLFMLAYALGRYTPVFGLAFDVLPGVGAFRRPADATFLVGAIAAILGGYLVHRCVAGTLPAASRLVRVGEAASVLAVLSLAVVIAVVHGHAGDAAGPIAAAVGWTLAAAGLAAALVRWRPSPGVAVAAVAALTTADLAFNNGPNESTALPEAQFEFLDPQTRNETVAELKRRLDWQEGSPWRDRIELAGLGFEWPNAALIHGFDHVLGYNPLRLRTVSEALGAGDTIAGPDQRRFSPLFPSYRSELARMMGLRYIATPVPIEQIDTSLTPGALPLVAVTKDAYVYENENVLPRAMFVPGWQRADFDTLVRTGRWPNFDPVQTVLLEAPPAAMPLAVASVDAGFTPMMHPLPERPIDYEVLDQSGAGSVNMPVYETTRVEIEVEAERPGYVVLNDVWHPWWRASVDGRPVPIQRANVLFRAVPVPAGTHRVVMTFEPVAGAIAELGDRLSRK